MNADKLVIRAKARAFIPDSSSFTTDLILEELNTAIHGPFSVALLKADGEYFTEVLDLLPDTYGNVIFPADALVSTARVLTWADASGNESPPLRRIEQGDIGSAAGSGGSGAISVEQPDHTFVTVISSGSGGYGAAPTSFALTPDGVRVFNYSVGGHLRCRYSRRPGDLVAGLATKVLVVTAITPGVSFAASSPDGLPAYSTGVWDSVALDRTPNASPFRRVALDQQITHIGLTDVWTYTGSQVAVGDVLTLPGTTYTPNAPTEWHDLLMYYAAATLASLRKDYDLEARRFAEAAVLFKTLLDATQPRTKQNPKVLSAWAGHTFRSRGLT